MPAGAHRPCAPAGALPQRPSAKRAPSAPDTDDPVHHFRGLLEHLATLTRNTVAVQGSEHPFEQLTVPTELQRTAFELLQVKLAV